MEMKRAATPERKGGGVTIRRLGAIIAMSAMILVLVASVCPAVTRWTANGVLVSSESGEEKNQQITTDEAGGAIITWQQFMGGSDWDIWAARVDSGGTRLWKQRLTLSSDEERNPRIAPDGAGGAIITYEHEVAGDWDVYVVRVDADGNTPWGGIPIANTSSVDEQFPMITSQGTASDLSGMATIVYQTTPVPPTNWNIQAAQVRMQDGSLNYVYKNVTTGVNDKTEPQLVSDAAGGAIVCYKELVALKWEVKAARVDNIGAVPWTTAIGAATDSEYNAKLATNGLGGAIVTYEQDTGGTNKDIWAAMVLINGSEMWYKRMTSGTDQETKPQITPDGSGGAVIAYQRYVGSEDIYGVKVDSSGTVVPGWPTCVQGGPDTEQDPQVTTDGSGGGIFTWAIQYSGDWDIRAWRLDANGVHRAFTIVQYLPSNAQNPQITSDGVGGAIVTWKDDRATDWDIYAQRVSNAAPTVTSITANSGTNDGPVGITNLAGTGFDTVFGVQSVRLMKTGQTDITATTVNVASSTKITCDFNLSGAAVGAWDVWVQNADGQSGTLAGGFTVTEAPPPPPPVPTTWYLAEGSTAWGYSCYISIENPNNEQVNADITYMTTDAGAVSGGTVTLPANSQTTVNPADTLGARDFSTRVECKEGKTIAVDRTMSWPPKDAGAGVAGDGHCSIGITAPAKTWYLAEGSSEWGFECWLLIQNPNAGEATCQVTYMIEGADPVTVEKKIPANSRETYNMANDIGAADSSIKVTADVPVIPERAMYRYSRQEGHDSIGTTAPATDYYLAEGTSAWGFTTYVLIQNPQGTATDVNVTYLTNSGPVAHPANPINMPANSRDTIRVNDFLPNSDFSTKVSGSQPIIAERAMYWGAGTELGEAAHDSIGMAEPHTTFYLPDGQTSEGYETYTLVANPNDSAVTVQITYLTPDGAGNVTFTESIGANSRMTYSMGDAGINGRAAVLVTSKTAGKKIMVERAMYWNNRGAGTDTIGGYSD